MRGELEAKLVPLEKREVSVGILIIVSRGASNVIIERTKRTNEIGGIVQDRKFTCLELLAGLKQCLIN